MFDTTVFNRIALHLAEIAAQIKKANELKAQELNLMSSATTVPVTPSKEWPPRFANVGTPFKAKTEVKEPWPFPTNDKP